MRIARGRRGHALPRRPAALGLAALALLGGPLRAQQSGEAPSLEEVKAEIDEAFAAIGRYSAQEREQALAALDRAFERLDTRIDALEERLRARWSEISPSARADASRALRDLRTKRNRLSEAYGALAHGTGEAWGELVAGVQAGWREMRAAWDRAAAASAPPTRRRD